MTIPLPIDALDEVQDATGSEDALDADEVADLVRDMWHLHATERPVLDRIYEYTKGIRGIPEVPEGASDEVRELARLSVKNVLALVRDSFAQNLSVVGYRTALAEENDPAWELWQRNRMDARQAEVYRPALQYGAAYVTVTPGGARGPVFRPRSPRQILAVYADPTLDAWPQYALETWVALEDAKPHRRGLLFDNLFMYALDFGPISAAEMEGASSRPLTLRAVDRVIPHGAIYEDEAVCPVVRFINGRDADDMIVGEVAPLITLQQAINNVNFDRLLVSRFGAFPQRVISGWQGTKAEALKASMRRVWAFDDPEVRAQAFPPASVEPYNSLLEEMMQHVAMVAQISPSQVTGKIANISAEALAAAEANQQRKLVAKRESFGESWEQMLRLAAEMDDDPETAADTNAEVVWRDTEARSFGAVVDGVTKLAHAGVPIEELLTMVPGMTQQTIAGIKDKVRAGEVKSIVDALLKTDQTDEVDTPSIDEVLDEVGDDRDVDEDGEDAARRRR